MSDHEEMKRRIHELTKLRNEQRAAQSVQGGVQVKPEGQTGQATGKINAFPVGSLFPFTRNMLLPPPQPDAAAKVSAPAATQGSVSTQQFEAVQAELARVTAKQAKLETELLKTRQDQDAFKTQTEDGFVSVHNTIMHNGIETCNAFKTLGSDTGPMGMYAGNKFLTFADIQHMMAGARALPGPAAPASALPGPPAPAPVAIMITDDDDPAKDVKPAAAGAGGKRKITTGKTKAERMEYLKKLVDFSGHAVDSAEVKTKAMDVDPELLTPRGCLKADAKKNFLKNARSFKLINGYLYNPFEAASTRDIKDFIRELEEHGLKTDKNWDGTGIDWDAEGGMP